MKLELIRKITALTLLLPMMLNWIDKRINESDDVRWNQQSNEWEWWGMKASTAKICNEYNHTIIAIIKW